jgi:hypothetical protein
MKESHASDSAEQREAESLMVGILAERIGIPLSPRTVDLGDGRRVELDAASEDLTVLVEAYARHGRLKPASQKKILADAFKLAYAARAMGGARLILLLADDAAAAPFRGTGWCAGAVEAFAIEVVVVDLPEDVRERVITAQKRQVQIRLTRDGAVEE